MKESRADFEATDGKKIPVTRWSPEGKAKAAVLIVHGMCEHGARYGRFARLLCERGYAVFVPDHRGHGRSAVDPGDLGFMAEKNGFFRVVEDLLELARRIKAEMPGKPLLIFGHSMGSFLARSCIAKAGQEFSACALSGTAGSGPYALGKALASAVCALMGPRRRASFLFDISLGPYNKAFKPSRTRFDWLSRDEEEVDAYVSDPLCGFPCPNAFYRDLFTGLEWIDRPQTLSSVPPALPIFLCSGSRDPVGGASGKVEELAERLRAAGVRKVDCRIYPEARHEILNETNRDEVMRDFADWMDSAVGPS